MQFLNTILFQNLIKWDLTATERKQFGSLHLSTVSQNEVQGTPVSEPPKVLAGFQGPISTSCFRASGPGAQEYEWVIIAQTCVWQAALLSNLFPHKGGCKLLYEKRLMWGSRISGNLSERTPFPSMLNLFTFMMPAISLLLHPSDLAQLPSVNSLADLCA